MTHKTTDTIPDPDWIAVEKGDKAKARERMYHFAGSVLIGEKLSRTDRLRIASALIGYKGAPVAFFGFGRRGPSAKKALEKVAVWKAVGACKEKLKANGEKQKFAYVDVAIELDMEDRTVKDWYEEIQSYLKQNEESSEALSRGIASLLP
ncbi:MAG: hypothetical protein GQ537_10800 [Gammaproteobacteria bacterium]|nr:hypothetical protein [Gammaproteobacteria bacterium]